MEDLSVDKTKFRQAVAAVVPYKPLYVKIKLTWQCNLRCKMCIAWKEKAESRLTFPVLSSLAQELADMGTRKVHFSGGEALLRPDIFDIISCYADHGMRVNLTTNGTLLTPKTSARLIASGIRNISVSLDGASSDIHDLQRGKGAWKKTIAGIRNLRTAANNQGLKSHIRINTVITKKNYLDLAKLPEIAYSAGADRLTLIPVNDPSGRFRLNKQRIREYNEKTAPRLAAKALELGMFEEAEQAYPLGYKNLELEYSKKGFYALGLYEKQPCFIPWIHTLIDPQGDIYPCCVMRSGRLLGNLLDSSGFQTVWEGKKYTRLRSRMLNPDNIPSACRTCDDFLAENQFLDRLGKS